MEQVMTYAQLKDHVEIENKDRSGKDKIYISRTKYNFCKNDACDNKRRHNSAYCGQCKFTK